MTTDHRPPTTDHQLSSDAQVPSSVVGGQWSAFAPGKLILCGEHAVVYRRPAIALPLHDVRAVATVAMSAPGSGITIDAPDLGRRWLVDGRPSDPLSELVVAALKHLSVATYPDLTISITSNIPVASGMGSGAAVATAVVRALAQFLAHELPADQVAALVYQSERRFHGTPSGIDNTVIAYERPIWFQRTVDQEPKSEDQRTSSSMAHGLPPTVDFITIAAPLALLIGDTGIRSATSLPVGEVHRRRQAEPARYEVLFDSAAEVALGVRDALVAGDVSAIGPLLDRNHALLQQIGVSSLELDRLVDAARSAGALGAKLSGAGWGGVMLALVTPNSCESVTAALQAAGAVRVLSTTVAPIQR